MTSNIQALYAVLRRTEWESYLLPEIENAVAALSRAEVDALPSAVISSLHDYDSCYPESNIWTILQDPYSANEYEEII